MNIVQVDSPNVIEKTVKVTYDSGSVRLENVLKDSYNNFFIETKFGKIYLNEFSNGQWLENKFKGVLK